MDNSRVDGKEGGLVPAKIAPRESVMISVPIEDLPRTDVFFCGRKTNPKMVSFSVKVFISLIVLGFSMYKLYKQAPCDCADDSVVYVSLITSILGVWLGASINR
jgi:hypothetical protein